MLAASAGGYDLTLVLGGLVLIIVVARLAAEASERIGVPPVLGEIVAGLVLGPSVLGLVDPIAHAEVADMVLLLGEIGVILLLMQVGLEMDLAELGRVGRSALLVGVVGVTLPFAAGFGVAAGFGESGEIALFIGAALTATSVGITARVLGDLRALSSNEARIVLGAAVADDILGLITLTVVVKVVTDGGVGAGVVLETTGLALGFLLVTGLLSVFVVPKALDRLDRLARSSTTIVTAGLAITIGYSLLANQAKLAFIIGAFMAGLGIGRSAHHERIAGGLEPLGHVFIPVFFTSIGINANLDAMFQPSVLALAGCLTVVAIVGKLVAGGAAARRDATNRPIDRLLIGIGMIPRGEVGLIFASIGLTQGILDDELYGAVLLMVLVTTVITPPLLKIRLGRRGPGPRAEWDAADTERLIDVLSAPTLPSMWSTLDDDFDLERRLPEIGSTMARRRAEPDGVDSSRLVHLPMSERIRELIEHDSDPVFQLARGSLADDRLLLLAAFVSDFSETGADGPTIARRLGDPHGETVALALVTSAELRDAARGPDKSASAVVNSVRDTRVALLAIAISLVNATDSQHGTLVDALEQVVRHG